MWWTVSLRRPDSSGNNSFVKTTAKYLWELASAETVARANAGDMELENDLVSELKEKIHDWDYVTPDGDKLPCSAENIDRLFRVMWIRGDTIRAWLDCSMGGARKKT